MDERGNLVTPVFQDPHDCVYGFFFVREALTFNADRLTVMLEEHVRIFDLLIHLAIIGESAFVAVYNDDGSPICIELLACVDPLPLGFQPSLVRKLRETPQFYLRAKDSQSGVRMSTTIALRPPTRIHRRDKFVPPESKAGQNGLYLNLPFEGKLEPRTIVSLTWRKEDKTVVLDLRSLHEYTTPSGLRIKPLTSRTRIQIPRG